MFFIYMACILIGGVQTDFQNKEYKSARYIYIIINLFCINILVFNNN